MADDITLNSGSGGATVRALEDAGSIKWPASVVCYATSVGTPDALQVVTGSAGLPVAQQGTWTVTANAGSGTFAVSAASLPLPSGASTAAKQPALGTAGSASSDVLTIQGIASMTAVKVDGSAVTQPVSGTVTANAGSGTFTVSGAVTQSGTWNVGTVTTVSAVTSITNAVTVAQSTAGNLLCTASQGGSWTVGQSGTWSVSLNAGTNLAGRVSSSAETSTVYNATTALTPKFAAISASSSGDNTVVSAVTSKKIRVLRWRLSANGAVNAKWKSSTTSDLTGLSYLAQYSQAGGAYCPIGIFETVAGEALTLNLSGAVATGGELTYIEI